MVFINGAKYACATCIKGHRSTTCQHSDRPLFAIKKKGRPISQCSHCRELRRTQKIHVKCNCAGRKKEESQSQAVAVLSQGILEEEEEYQPTSGDKTSVEALLNPCQCLTGAECICCRPVEQYFSDCNSKQYESSTNNDTDNSSYYLQMTSNSVSSAQTPCILPPISGSSSSANNNQQIGDYDNNKGKSFDPQFPFVSSWPSYSTFTNVNRQNLQERPYSSPSNDKDNTYRDQSDVLGKEICSSTPADLAKIIYRPFKGCSSAKADGSCCGSNNLTVIPICRCGSSCKCSGCDAHAERVDFGNSNTSQPNQSKPLNCCSSSFEITQPEQPEHTVIRDGDGVLLCGCGCQKLNTECSDCQENLCEEFLFKEPPM